MPAGYSNSDERNEVEESQRQPNRGQCHKLSTLVTCGRSRTNYRRSAFVHYLNIVLGAIKLLFA